MQRAAPKLDKRSLRIAQSLRSTSASRLLGAAAVAKEKAHLLKLQAGPGAVPQCDGDAVREHLSARAVWRIVEFVTRGKGAHLPLHGPKWMFCLRHVASAVLVPRKSGVSCGLSRVA